MTKYITTHELLSTLKTEVLCRFFIRVLYNLFYGIFYAHGMMWTKSSKEITVNEQIVFQFTRIFSKLCFSSHVFSANCVSLLLSINVLRTMTVQRQFLRLVTFETLITILTILNLNS